MENKLNLVQEYERKTKQFNIRLSEQEYKTIYKLCKEKNLSKGEFIRKCINEYASNYYSEYCIKRISA